MKPLNVLNCYSYCDRSFKNKYCDKCFINKPVFLNFVPQLIRKIYHTSIKWFYRFAWAIVAQAHISLMTRLFYIVLSLFFLSQSSWFSTTRYVFILAAIVPFTGPSFDASIELSKLKFCLLGASKSSICDLWFNNQSDYFFFSFCLSKSCLSCWYAYWQALQRDDETIKLSDWESEQSNNAL